MRDYPAKRPPGARRLTSHDLALWSGLVAAALLTAAKPDRAGPITGARKKVKGKPMPQGQYVAGSAFDRLCRLSLAWVDLLIEQRRARASELEALARECAGVLAAGEAGEAANSEPGRRPRRRADIDDRED